MDQDTPTEKKVTERYISEGTEKGASSSSPRDSNIRITDVHFQVPPEYSILKGLFFVRTVILFRFRPLSCPFLASSA